MCCLLCNFSFNVLHVVKSSAKQINFQNVQCPMTAEDGSSCLEKFNLRPELKQVQ